MLPSLSVPHISDAYISIGWILILTIFKNVCLVVFFNRIKASHGRKQPSCPLPLKHQFLLYSLAPQWGAADAEIKVPSGENTELKHSPFKAWSRSVYSHACYAYCRGFLSCLFLHFQSVHLHFFQNLSRFFPVLAVANTWFLCRPAE